MTQETWPARLARIVAGEIRRHRAARGLTARQLAERCSELGLPLSRNVIASLESGRRPVVGLAELIVLARVLEVPPVLLVAPVGYGETVEILPGLEATPYGAAQWFSGEADLTDAEPRRRGMREWPNLVDPRSPLYPLQLFREHDALVATLRDLAVSLIPAAESRDPDFHGRMLTVVTAERGILESELGQLRRLMAGDGLALPPLPDDVTGSGDAE